MEMTSLLGFDLQDDSIRTAKGNFYCFRLFPMNFSTLDDVEKTGLYQRFEGLMRQAAELPFRIFACDRTVDLSANRTYISGFPSRFAALREEILGELGSFASDKGNTQRAYYFILRAKSRDAADRFQSCLGEARLVSALCGRQELAVLLRGFFLREFVDEDLYLGLPDPSLPRDVSPWMQRLLPSQLCFERDYIRQPGFLRRVFTLRNLPQTISAQNRAILFDLIQRPGVSIQMYISDMGALQVKELVEKQLNNTFASRFKRRQTDKLAAAGEYDSLTEFYQDCLKDSSQGGAVKYVSLYLELYAQDEPALAKASLELKSFCSNRGVTIEPCSLRQKEGFLGILPFGTDSWGRLMANNIPSNTFGYLYPFSASSLIDSKGVVLGHTKDGGLIAADIFKRDPIRTNSGVVVVGDSGQGKSYLIKKLVSQLVPAGVACFLVDAENEYSEEVRRLDGTAVDPTQGEYGLNPFDVRLFRKTEDDDESAQEDYDPSIAAFQKTSPLFQHLSWLSDFFVVLIPEISQIQLSALNILVQDVYGRMGITEQTDLSQLSPEDYPTFTEVYDYIREVLEHRQKYPFYQMIDDQVLKELLLLLHDVYRGGVSPILNRRTNLPNSQLVNLDIQVLLTGSEKSLQAVLFNYLTYFWSRILRRENRMLLVLDELYLVLNQQNPTIAKYLNSYVRRARKYDAALIVGTQKLRDCLHEDLAFYTAAIFDTPTYKFLFYPGNVDFELVKAKLHLTSGEIQCINRSNQRHCLLKIGNVDKFQVEIGTLPFEAELFGKGGGR